MFSHRMAGRFCIMTTAPYRFCCIKTILVSFWSMTSIYTAEQQKVLFWSTKLPALFSIACSSVVIYHLCLDKRNRLYKVYGRLWFLISVTNILVAFLSMVASLATPEETGIYGAYGNEASCVAMGATFMFLFVICMGYNAYVYNVLLRFQSWVFCNQSLPSHTPFILEKYNVAPWRCTTTVVSIPSGQKQSFPRE